MTNLAFLADKFNGKAWTKDGKHRVFLSKQDDELKVSLIIFSDIYEVPEDETLIECFIYSKCFLSTYYSHSLANEHEKKAFEQKGMEEWTARILSVMMEESQF